MANVRFCARSRHSEKSAFGLRQRPAFADQALSNVDVGASANKDTVTEA
jgi:hypothetical protein